MLILMILATVLGALQLQVVPMKTAVMNALFGKERGADDIEETRSALLYLGILARIFVFLGYVLEIILDNLNITDPNALPIFGPIISPIQNAMNIGGTVLLVLFLLFLIGALVDIAVFFRRVREVDFSQQ